MQKTRLLGYGKQKILTWSRVIGENINLKSFMKDVSICVMRQILKSSTGILGTGAMMSKVKECGNHK